MKQVEIKLNESKKVLERLRRLTEEQKAIGSAVGGLEEDEHGEFLPVKFNSQNIKFYVGHSRVVPEAWANGLLARRMPMDAKCRNCNGDGATAAGICYVCKGDKWRDTKTDAILFVKVREFDPVADAPSMTAPPKQTKSAAHAA